MFYNIPQDIDLRVSKSGTGYMISMTGTNTGSYSNIKLTSGSVPENTGYIESSDGETKEAGEKEKISQEIYIGSEDYLKCSDCKNDDDSKKKFEDITGTVGYNKIKDITTSSGGKYVKLNDGKEFLIGNDGSIFMTKDDENSSDFDKYKKLVEITYDADTYNTTSNTSYINCENGSEKVEKKYFEKLEVKYSSQLANKNYIYSYNNNETRTFVFKCLDGNSISKNGSNYTSNLKDMN